VPNTSDVVKRRRKTEREACFARPAMELVYAGSGQKYNSSPRQNTRWLDSMKSLGITNLHLDGPAIDDQQLEHVRSKKWGAA